MAGKKKLSKKEKARMEAEQAELLRIEMEKERVRKIEEERERQEKEREEAEKRQKQEITENKFRRVQLKKSSEAFESIKNEINKINAELKVQKEWERYMRCNGLPNAQQPSDLRKYIHIWLEKIEKFNLEEKNWLLQIDETSILTQNQTVKNLTKISLKKQQPILGDIYAERIVEVLGILEEMQEVIDDGIGLSNNIIVDLHDLKKELRDILSKFIDEFSYKILCNISRDMTLTGPITATHIYESSVLNAQLWTQRDIPQPPLNPKEKLKEETRNNEIDFEQLGVNVVFPPTIKLKFSAFRGLWLNYDHFSDYCPSYKNPYRPKSIKDLRTTTKIEWLKRKKILEESLETNTEERSSAVPFDALEPPPSRIVDVEKLYSEYEEEINKKKRRKKGPDALNLPEFIVNLRSHRIVGGIYALDYLEQPQQEVKVSQDSFLRTIGYPSQLSKKLFYQSYKPPPPPLPGVRRLPEEIEAEIKLMEKNLDRLALVSIQLKDNVLWFEPPIVCRWETAEETKISEDLIKAEEKRKNSKEVVDSSDDELDEADAPRRLSSEKKRKKRSSRKVRKIQDFNLIDIPSHIDIYFLMRYFVVPRLPDGYGVKIEMGRNERKSSILRHMKNETNDSGLDSNNKKGSGPSSINDILYKIDEPRTLQPHTTLRRKLKIVLKKSSGEGNGYLFSHFLKDLDMLNELQTPKFEIKLDEIVCNLTPPKSPDKKEIERKISIEKEDEISIFDLDFLTKKKVVETLQEILVSVESESESEMDSFDDKSTSEEEKEDGKLIGQWSTRDVHDVKYNEDKLTIQFRTGRLGYFGIASSRYSNLPYQTWELKPDSKVPDCVTFSITAAVISIEVTLSVDGVRLNNMQGGSLEPIESIIGVTQSLQKLIKYMRTVAADIFPENDAFCYTEGSCEKNGPMEAHLYHCMANLALTHNFSWSRWNLLSGSRTAVLLMREILENRKAPNQSTLFVTPLKTCVVDCTEVSASFNTAGISGMDYYADLHHLSNAHSHPVSKEKQKNMSAILRDNVIQILKATRPLSFC